MGFRQLYHEIMEYKGNNFFTDVLKTWESNNRNYLKPIVNYDNLSNEDNWEFYALSRVLDILTLRFQPNKNVGNFDWDGPNISLDEYIEFVKLLGFEINYPSNFSPFDCEIIETKRGKNNFDIMEYLFPSIRLKGLMVKRAGVIISNSPDNYDLNLINNAKIFWSYRRKNRKHEDLSHGWGSNSQWRTDFRFDVETENLFIYNIKGKYNLNNIDKEVLNELNEQNLELNEIIELLVNRQFVKCAKNEEDIFPYDFKYSENIKL